MSDDRTCPKCGANNLVLDSDGRGGEILRCIICGKRMDYQTPRVALIRTKERLRGMGEMFRQRRNELKLRQSDVANQIKTSVSFIGMVERGEHQNEPDVQALREYYDRLELELAKKPVLRKRIR
jgi:DNA-binding XRE family transcriptional regulator